jgi:hypothetical protein
MALVQLTPLCDHQNLNHHKEKYPLLVSKVNSGSILESGPLIVSRDGYVVDGHHRWGAFMNRAPNTPIPVIIMNATIQEVLESAAAWGARTVAFGDAK